MKRSGTIDKKTTSGISNPNEPRLFPLKKAAEYLGLTTWAMRERVWAGDIPVVRFNGGRKMYLDRHDLDSFIEQNKTVIL
ncbi:MAG: helix-turn-helix domain-containing protein [Syntrophales bacterium]|jgi:excisionase family DNA binding protein|nr:helix-turn-helix domain-containing protein [Syntrophales bacterium]MDY0044416.1 helix-turn-helix domain-containing protein [Syntrophales bacterium]